MVSNTKKVITLTQGNVTLIYVALSFTARFLIVRTGVQNK
jgi:hypothetical protein